MLVVDTWVVPAQDIPVAWVVEGSLVAWVVAAYLQRRGKHHITTHTTTDTTTDRQTRSTCIHPSIIDKKMIACDKHVANCVEYKHGRRTCRVRDVAVMRCCRCACQ